MNEIPAIHSRLHIPICASINGLSMLLLLVVYIPILQQIKMEERDADFGDGLNFFMVAVPVLGLCLLVNVYWLIRAVQDLRRRSERYSLVGLTATAAGWVFLYVGSFWLQ